MQRMTLLVGLLFSVLCVAAQPYEKKGAEILDQVAAKIKTYKTIKIDFSYILSSSPGRV